VQTLQYFFFKFRFFFAHQKLEKTPQKAAYLWQLGVVVFSAALTAQNSPELHFRFMNSVIQPSLVGSVDALMCDDWPP
jgi:hypothetical protein